MEQHPMKDLMIRDLNKNGRLDPYEDPSRPIDERVEDLLSQMTLAEKAGMMMHAMIMPGAFDAAPPFGPPITTHEMVINRHMSYFNVLFAPDAVALAAWYNQLQKLAENTRLGIPITISTDPRHSVQNNPGAALTLVHEGVNS